MVMLSELCAQLFFELVDEFGHDRFYQFIIHGVLVITQNEINGVALFPVREVLAFIYVKEFYAFKELAFGLSGNLLDLCESHVTVKE